MKKILITTVIFTALVGVTCLTVFLLIFGITLFIGNLTSENPDKTISNNAILLAKQESQENSPALSLVGIWQKNKSMAAGWADRYHFYPSGTFHFYPNEMICSEEKIEVVGTWKFENSMLTLTTNKQIINAFEIDPGGLCHVINKKEAQLTKPINEQFTIVDLGTLVGDIYPSMMINDQQFWKYSDDASSYGDEKFPELK